MNPGSSIIGILGLLGLFVCWTNSIGVCQLADFQVLRTLWVKWYNSFRYYLKDVWFLLSHTFSLRKNLFGV